MNSKKQYINTGLSFHFVSRLIVMSCILAAVIISILLYMQKQIIFKDHTDFAIVTANNLAANCGYGFITGDREILENLIRGIKIKGDIVYAAIVENDVNKSVLAEFSGLKKSMLPIVDGRIDKTKVAIRNLRNGSVVIDVISPVLITTGDVIDEEGLFTEAEHIRKKADKKRFVGYVRLGVSMDKKLFELRQTSWKIVAVIVLLILSFSIYQYSHMRNIVIIPLEKVIKGTEEFGKGNLGYKVEVTRGNEIGELANAFNLSISELKKSSEALAKSEERFRELLETIPHGIQENNTSGIITYANPAICRMTGYDRKELEGMAVWEKFASEPERKTLPEYLEKLVKEKPYPEQYIAKYARKDGSVFDAQVDWNYIMNDKGEVTGFTSVITDITERKKSEQSLKIFTKKLIETQENERKRIAAELHDSLAQNLLAINNVIKNHIRLSTAKSGELEPLEHASSMAIDVVDQIREISYNLRPAQLDKLGIKKGIESLAGRLSASSGIDIVTNIRLGKYKMTPSIEINIFRIVQEGLNNIIKHSCAKSALVNLCYKDNIVSLGISDDGKGFNPNSSSHNKCVSMGYGLNGIPERVKMLGGEYTLESAIKKGTSISITIPG